MIAQRLNELVDLNAMQKLKTTSITKFLLRAGLLFAGIRARLEKLGLIEV